MFKIYRKLPLFLQDIIVTIYNSYSNYQKFSYIPIIKSFKILQKESLSVIINEDVDVNFKKIMDVARNEIEYFSENEIYKEEVDFSSISKLPVLDKIIVKQQCSKFINKNCSNSRSFRTSGSTGSPMTGQLDVAYLKKRYRIYLKLLTKLEVDFSNPYGRFVGKELVSSDDRIYRKDIINSHFIFSIYQLDETHALQYYNAIKQNNIEVLEAYPSVVHTLVILFKKLDLPELKLKLVIVTAEKLHNYQKESIESFFKCDVFDYYGSNEASTFIYYDIDSKSYLSSTSTGIVEVLDDYGNIVKPGNEGNMIITNYNRCMPLIRYNIGDRCILHEDQNGLKKGVVRIKEILGRDDEVLILEDGKRFTRFSLLLKYLPDYVDSSQLVINTNNKTLKVNFTSSINKFNDNEFSYFKNEYNRLVSSDFSISVEKVSKLEKSKYGKIRTVIIE
jgi:phenylacetate-coenzyme A ligase PaaK-like adenylate-forming protein